MLICLKYDKGHLNIGREEGLLYETTFQCVIIVNPILGGVMQFCITLYIFARRTPKNEFLPSVMV